MAYNYKRYHDIQLQPKSDYNAILKPFLLSTLKSYETYSILDVGCGSGILLDSLIELNVKINYTGIDRDAAALSYCSSMYQPIFPVTFLTENEFLLQSKQNHSHFDLTIASLSLCEMSDESIIRFISSIDTKQWLVINPSTLTFFYPTVITKTWVSKIKNIAALFGNTYWNNNPEWRMISRIPKKSDMSYTHYIQGHRDLPATLYYRSFGQLLNLFQLHNFQFKKYWELKSDISDVKQPFVPKFEAFLVSK